jgi:SAM-dependent methyltransferase
MRESDPGYDMERYWAAVHRLDRLRDIDELSLVMHHDLPRYYNELYNRLERRAYARAWRRAGLPVRGHCLEIGPGRGRWTARLLARGLEVTGVDISEDAVVRLGQLFPRARFEVGTASRLSAASATIDVVSSVVVLLHLPPADKQAAIEEIGRVLKPGGHALLIESTHATDRAAHVFPLRAEEWIEGFHRAGMELVYRRGQEFVPLLRLAEALHRSAVESGPGSGVRGHVLRGLDRGFRRGPVRRLLVGVSGVLEPWVERLVPARWGRHGVFVFRRRR